MIVRSRRRLVSFYGLLKRHLIFSHNLWNLEKSDILIKTKIIAMTTRRKMVLKPMSPATLLCKEQNPINETIKHTLIQAPAPIVSPTNEKKKILLQESIPPIIPRVQHNKVLLPCTISPNLSDSDDSDFDDPPTNNFNAENQQKSNIKLYYSLFCFFCWAAIQYWMITVAGFGAVFFALSALIAIFLNTTKTDKKQNVLSAYSVFNPQCTPIQGSADPKQLERELMFGGL